MELIHIQKNPSSRFLRQFGCIWLAFFAFAGGYALHRTGSVPAAAAVWGGGGAVGLAGFLHLPFMRLVYLGMSYAVLPIGLVVGYFLMAVVYFGVFSLVALIMRLIGRDPLRRCFDRSSPSYWLERGPPPPPERYFRQF